ncbi:MAG: cell wall hydrolase [Maricaulis sp.]|jgi:hypothetical protein|uniref:cell wall hydrolase n=1 Tax=Maricaulis sp. TaxID=1486257 RepID=UPI001B0B5F4B|nr:cell wall hydrolase [Maricaulis sp.]MBO6730938.1 cell wall hydrolase [Maricaulis sp.]MBO6848579.1 cell wall hydrolase [Maricaulis sp.]MBO6878800.1 cell wall hydrolase [Maricaulis sp.]
MSSIERMDMDTARSQQKQVATAIHLLAMILLCFAVVGAMNAASHRARVQDENLAVMAIASRYLTASEREDAYNPDPISMGALQLVADRQDGVRLESRPLSMLRTFEFEHFELASDQARELNCLSEAIYYEARSERQEGQLAVAQVVMNRKDHPAYPDSICGVVYQGSERRTGCQFTFTCDGSLERGARGRAWTRSQEVALHVFMGFRRDITRRATHYHTTAVDPHWNDSLVRTRRIGTHIFYRNPTRRERLAGVVTDRDA